MKKLKKALVLLAFGIAVILIREWQMKQLKNQSPQISGTAKLVRVVDGDTIVVRMEKGDEDKVNAEGREGGLGQKIRIIGIDTPESVKPNTPVECFANEATAHISELLNAAGKLKIETDPTQDTRDNYGRLLAHVFVDDMNIGQQLIADGYAYEYTYREPYIYQSEYKAAEKFARANNLGLWSPDTCNGES